MKGNISMSVKEANRITVLDQLARKQIKQKKAAEMMGLSVRQIRRLKKKYKALGIIGLKAGRIKQEQ